MRVERRGGLANGRCVIRGWETASFLGKTAQNARVGPPLAGGNWLQPQPHNSMMAALGSLNYLAVIVVAIAGFIIGWLWYGVLFGKAWMAEMKITPEAAAAAKSKMAKFFAGGFLCTVVSTFALAWLLAAHHTAGALKGTELGAMLGLLLVGARFANSGVWEQRTCKLTVINVAHEVVMFAVQGAILAVWR